MCAKSASATRSSFQRSDSARTRRNRIERCQRSPATSVTCIDAEPSCRIDDDRRRPNAASETRACGRASATIVQAGAAIAHSQNSSPPTNGRRSRTGNWRRLRNRRTSRRYLEKRQNQRSASAPGTTSSQSSSGEPKLTDPTQPFRSLAPPLPASRSRSRSSDRCGMIILKSAMLTPCGGAPARPCSAGVAGGAAGFAVTLVARASVLRVRDDELVVVGRVASGLGLQDVGVGLDDVLQVA